MRVCLIGAAGFIGSHVIDELYSHDIKDITVVDNFSTGRRDNITHSVNIVERDIAGLGDFFKLNKFDFVANLAAQVSTFDSVLNPERDFRTNAEGMFYLLEALRKADYKGGFIYTSSRSIYSHIPAGTANEDTPYAPSSVYNTHKYYGEILTRLYSKLYGLNAWILRPSNVYGPRQPAVGLYGFLNRWIAWTIQDKPIPIWGSGTQQRDFVYVTDIARAYRNIIEIQPEQRTFLLSTGLGVNLLDLANSIMGKIGKGRIEYKPAKAGDIQRFVGDSTLANDILDWKPEYNLDNGLDKSIEWVKNNIDRYGDYNL